VIRAYRQAKRALPLDLPQLQRQKVAKARKSDPFQGKRQFFSKESETASLFPKGKQATFGRRKTRTSSPKTWYFFGASLAPQLMGNSERQAFFRMKNATKMQIKATLKPHF
jgi:hypothetical protein